MPTPLRVPMPEYHAPLVDCSSPRTEGGGDVLPQILSAIQELGSSQRRVERELAQLTAAVSARAPPDLPPQQGTGSRRRSSRRSARRSGGSPVADRPQRSSASGHANEDENSGTDSANSGMDMAGEGSITPTFSNEGSLPKSWPASLEPRSGFEDAPGDAQLRRALEKSLSRLSQLGKRASIGSSAPSSTGSWRWVLDPDSAVIRFNDLLGVSVLMHDLLLTPFLIAWDVRTAGALLILAWACGVYWALDLALGFATGFYRDGELILKQPDACIHQLRTSFVPNCLLLVADSANLFLVTFASSESYGLVFEGATVLRMFKAIRLLKVLRIARLLRLMDKMTASDLSTGIHVGMQVLKVVCGTFLIAHLLCCAWHLAGREGPSDTGLRWPDGLEDYEASGRLYQYFTALHWAMAQITLGASDAMPLNWFERSFSIVLLVCGLIYGSSMVAIVSAQIVSLSMVKQEQSQALLQLRKFLRQHSVPRPLVAHVTHQAFERLFAERALREEDVAALQLLSSTLRAELLCETRKQQVLSHPLFRVWAQHNMATVHSLCQEAAGFTLLPRGDVLFTPGSAAEKAYYSDQGTLLYAQFPGTSRVLSQTRTYVRHGSWLCEAALWCHWTHVGKLEAASGCRLLFVEAAGLMRTLAEHVAIASATKAYCRSFHARLTCAVPPHAHWPSDVSLPFEASELLSTSLGIALSHRARREGRLSEAQAAALEEQLQSGLCTLQPATGRSGGIERIISSVAVRLEHDDRTFVQVGKAEEGEGVQAACRLPRTKRRAEETPQKALERLLETSLRPLAPHIAVERSEHSVLRGASEQRFGVLTTYVQTVHTARLQTSFEDIAMPTASAREPLDVPELSAILPRDVYVVHVDQSLALFCWLTQEEQDLLEEPESAAHLQRWLDSLELVRVGAD